MKRFLLIAAALAVVIATVLLLPGLFDTGGDLPAPSVDLPPEQAPEKVEVYDLHLTEVMPDNKTLCMGHNLDWVELYNREDTEVSLDGYFLTDTPNLPEMLSLAGLRIPADGYLAVSLEDSAAFHLSSKGETVYLTCNGEIIDQLAFPLTEDGESYSPEGVCPYPTPGFANTEEGYLAYLEVQTLPDLILSEVISSNGSLLPVDGEFYDLVEVFNRSDAPLNLGEYTLSDKRSEPTRYTFPAVTLAPGECYVVYCSGVSSLGENHASFKISSSGERIYLSKGGVFTDVLTIPADLERDKSYGRTEKQLLYYDVPTLGAVNGEGYRAGIAVPTANLPSGIYGEPISLSLQGAGTVYYTLDGSRPTLESAVYTEPIFIEGVVTVRTFCVEGTRSSAPAAYTYIIGGTHDLPIVSVSLPQDRLTGEEAGILNHIDVTYEYDGIVTLIENGEERFSVPVGFRLHGNGSRTAPKQNFQLRFRSEYGAGKLKYPLFEDRPFEEYDSLLLKGGSEDWNQAVMRDELCTGLVDGTTALAAQAIKPVVLYLGGEYWGIYYLRERFNDDYVADHLGVSPESVDILYSSGAYRQTGSDKLFKEIRNYVSTNDMSTPENYAWLCERIDATSLMDWYICRSYFGDKDTANIRRYRSSEGDGKWRWMFFDLDWAFYHTTDAPLTSISTSGGDHLIFRALVASEEGKDAFLKRYAELMNSFLNEQTILAAIDTLAGTIESEIPRDRERWGRSVEGWNSAVERLRRYVRDGARTKRVLEDLQSYFALTEEQMQTYFGQVTVSD